MPADERTARLLALPVEVQLGNDDLGQGLLHAGVAPAVEGLRVGQEVECQREELPSGIEFGGGVGQLSLDLGPLDSDPVQLPLDLSFRPARFPHQVEELLFFGVQLAQTSHEPLFETVDAAQLAQYGVVELSPDLGPELVAQADGGVVLLDCPFDVLDFEVGLVAAVSLAAPAHEVEVGGAVAMSGRDDQALAAPSAPDQPFQPVVVLPLPGTATAAQGEYPLYPLEQYSPLTIRRS